MRLAAAAVILALAASGCEKKEDGSAEPLSILSKTSLFKGAANSPVLRSGLWLRVDEACPVDEAQPVASWPECARSVLIAQGRMAEKGETASRAYVFSGGSPRVMQVEYRFPAGVFYEFEVVVPLASDDRGQVTALWRGALSCRLPDPPTETAGPETVENPCEARSADKVFNLAQGVELGSKPNFRWIRDGEN